MSEYSDRVGDEASLLKRYLQANESEVQLLGVHTTRPLGFCDMLLSGELLCSKEVQGFLRNVQKHRGPQSQANGGISFSLGHVSFRYSNREIRCRDSYRNGLGVLLPAEQLIEMCPWRVSHCSSAGGLSEKELSPSNILEAVHRARRDGRLFCDGYGNVFELILSATENGGKVAYPRISLTDSGVLLAIPGRKRRALERMLSYRQEMWRQTDRDLESWPGRYKVLRSRLPLEDLLRKRELKLRVKKYLKTFSWERFRVFWYDDRNLDYAHLRLSLKEVVA